MAITLHTVHSRWNWAQWRSDKRKQQWSHDHMLMI